MEHENRKSKDKNSILLIKKVHPDTRKVNANLMLTSAEENLDNFTGVGSQMSHWNNQRKQAWHLH